MRLTQTNSVALQQAKLKLVQLQEFQDLEPHEQVTIINLVEAGILLYLDSLAELIVRLPGETIN
jgi:hypothetical protein